VTATTPQQFDDVGECVEAALRRLGNRIVLGAPLGIGKPNALLNEFYRRAAREPGLSLTIVTALSLNRPAGRSDLENRFLGPFVERLFGDYPDLEYLRAARARRLPPNVEVREFYLQAGAWLGVDSVQQHYISVDYSDVVAALVALGVNVIAQEVAVHVAGGATQLSLASNPDLTLDLLPFLDAERAAGRTALLVGAVNRRMPFMPGDGVLPPERFDLLLDSPRYDHDLYCPPNLPIHTVEHAIGVGAAALVRDGGTLQLGIGEMGDAVVYALQLRQQRNADFRDALAATGAGTYGREVVRAVGGEAPLERGVYACTEMFVDGFLDLYRAGVLSRRVYPHAALQRLLDDGVIGPRLDAETLVALARAGVEWLDAAGFAGLERAGLFLPGTRFEPPATVLAPGGQRLGAHLADPATRAALAAHCLARRLDGGRLLHAGFFLGPRGFYGALHGLATGEREQFAMTRIAYTNTLHGPDYALKVAQRRHARFINTTMMVTGLGAAVSDALDSGQVVSGVGGQHDFVTMAHALPEARSILLLRSTRRHQGTLSSNIVWNYGHTTIPRHLRDLVVTEYGIADLRGRTDRDCVVALLGVCDARFQPGLLAAARRAGKIEHGYRLPDALAANTPEAIAARFAPLRARGLFSEFPFGTDFSAEEAVLARALGALEARTARLPGRIGALVRAAFVNSVEPELAPYLERLGLLAPGDFRARLSARLVALELRRALAPSAR
jgi:acyl-CoA hydrolase